MSDGQPVFNPPPGWPQPPDGWQPPAGWTPDPTWPDPPVGWELWLSPDEDDVVVMAEPRLPEIADTSSERAELIRLRAEVESLRQQVAGAGDEVALNDDLVLQSVGIYRYHHPLENAAAYKTRLDDVSVRTKELVKSKEAIERSNMFTFDNSLAKGRKMTDDLSRLMLRAYNAEADNCIRSLRAGNVQAATKRLEASRSAIAKLGRMMEMRISDGYHSLRLEEIELTADFMMKKQEEKEAEREERARLREEQKVQKELEQQRAELAKERAHLEQTLESLRASGGDDPELTARLAEVDEAIDQNDFRAANIRAGYVYVISNRGAFGPDVVKIGLTRRLKPMERVSELSGAAVPFRFDVHALFFTEDAVTLESELHSHFAHRRLNHANIRKEFFFASPEEVREVLLAKVGNLLEFADHADATEYFQSVGSWPTATTAGP